MSPELPQFMRGTTNENQEDRNNDYLKDAVIILAIIGIVVTLVQVKIQNKSKSPFETDFAIMVAFLVALHVYFFALLARKKLIETHKTYAQIIKYYIHLCGFLSNVLLMMMLVPILGRIFLGMWVCCFIIVTYCLLEKINVSHVNVRNEDELDGEPNENDLNQDPNKSTNEVSNGDDVHQAPDESTGEETNNDNSAIRTFEIALEIVLDV